MEKDYRPWKVLEICLTWAELILKSWKWQGLRCNLESWKNRTTGKSRKSSGKPLESCFWKSLWNLELPHTLSPTFSYHLFSGQSRCKTCPENTYAMPGASRCIPLLNCTSDDIIAAPGDVNSCSCETSPNGFECKTTVQPEYIKVHGKLLKVLNPFVLRSDQWVISP